MVSSVNAKFMAQEKRKEEANKTCRGKGKRSYC